MIFCKNAAPLLVVFGQSNAHGHGTLLPEQERVTVPLGNVFGLSRVENQAYDQSDVHWSGFVTHGMNLGETQDHTYCLAESFARLWQAAIDRGERLPELYILQISIGGQGIAQFECGGANMWYPGRARIMKNGALDAVDISLYPLAIQSLRNCMTNLSAAGKQPQILGLHWNQWETEVNTGTESVSCARENYRALFEGFRAAVGCRFPLWLYEPLSLVYENPQGLAQMQSLFEEFAARDEDVQIMRTSAFSGYDPARRDQGIFLEDCVHYLPEVHRWFALRQFQALNLI